MRVQLDLYINLHQLWLEPPQCLISSNDSDDRGVVIHMLVYAAQSHFKVCKRIAGPFEDVDWPYIVLYKCVEQMAIVTTARG